MKIPPVGAELFNTFVRKDMAKLIVAFRNFVNTHSELSHYFSAVIKLKIRISTVATSLDRKLLHRFSTLL